MAWQQTIEEWRRLSAEEQRRVWWSLIPLRVSQSMAFEREPVDLEWRPLSDVWRLRFERGFSAAKQP
jgi:hypothetical protein